MSNSAEESSNKIAAPVAFFLIPVVHLIFGALFLAIVFFVLPVFEAMIGSFGMQLPIPTQITLNLVGKPAWHYALSGLFWVFFDGVLLHQLKDDAKGLWMFLGASLFLMVLGLGFMVLSLSLPIYSLARVIGP